MIILKVNHWLNEEQLDILAKDAIKFGFVRSDETREWTTLERREAAKFAIAKITVLHTESKC